MFSGKKARRNSDLLTPVASTQTSAAAFVHSIVCYLSPPSTSMKVFSGPRATPAHKTSLLAHTYATKNVYTGLIRGYAAYHITNAQVYDLAMWTFAGVLAFYGGELLVWKTVRAREFAFPLVTAGLGLGWMWMQKGWYVG